MKKLFFVFLLIFCGKISAVVDICLLNEKHYCLTSMVKIVANPQLYYGKKIAIHGVFEQDLGHYLIFIDTEKSKIKSTVDAVELGIDKGLANELMKHKGDYISFRGTFNENLGSNTAGILEDITIWDTM
ncbi:hypothetical protein MK852_09845 [Shewanella benthica]|uniref:hypothetical protein n=1 Tax=Shewanella benthica TaxID=43661 RepID=UPI00187A3FE6|nr:hypothetical protein [Shewanella benthica]MBE7215531.1 hypothetical protein [Shewanella benthica]MCL1062440.1 hypothetical protein [Shewanella benthica]